MSDALLLGSISLVSVLMMVVLLVALEALGTKRPGTLAVGMAVIVFVTLVNQVRPGLVRNVYESIVRETLPPADADLILGE